MGVYLNNWITMLQTTDSAAALPLGVGGIGLMLAGWRFWKLAVVLAFGCLGALAGAILGRGDNQQLLYGLVGFVVVGAASMPPVMYSVAVLGGIIGAAIVNHTCQNAGLSGSVLWMLTAISMICATSLAFLNLRQVVMIITSFLGAGLLLSALVACLSAVPSIYNYLSHMAQESTIFLPFVLLVPTVVGTFLQAADANRKDFSLTN